MRNVVARSGNDAMENSIVLLSKRWMKGGLGLLPLFVLMLGQFHGCPPEWLTAKGTACVECLGLQDDHSELGDEHGDCHDCCSLRSCEHEEVSANRIAFFPALDCLVILEGGIDIPLPPIVTVDAKAPDRDGERLANAPPEDQRLRAPPANAA